MSEKVQVTMVSCHYCHQPMIVGQQHDCIMHFKYLEDLEDAKEVIKEYSDADDERR